MATSPPRPAWLLTAVWCVLATGVAAAAPPGAPPHGSIQGVVRDEQGLPVAGAMVAAFGVRSAVAVTDRDGRFTIGELPPGPYVLRAHLTGFTPRSPSVVRVTANGQAASAIALDRRQAARTDSTPGPTLADPDPPAPDRSSDSSEQAEELKWRLLHLTRHVLKETDPSEIVALLGEEDPAVSNPGGGGWPGGQTAGSMRESSSSLRNLPFTGELNFLTSSGYRDMLDLGRAFNPTAGGIAYLSVGALPGARNQWNVSGAVIQGAVSSWRAGGEYRTELIDAHSFTAGVAYASQRYDNGSPGAISAVADDRRWMGTAYGRDRWLVGSNVALEYGMRYDRYGYLEQQSLISPRVSLSLAPAPGWSLRATAARRALAPGAEEFAPPVLPGVWMPPARTFSPLDGRPLEAERTRHYEISLERALDVDTIAVRSFVQRTADQLVALFGEQPDGRGYRGHYSVANRGHVATRGVGVSLQHRIAGRVNGSVAYTFGAAKWPSVPQAQVLNVWFPALVAHTRERVHDVTTSVETTFHSTNTRVFVLYKINSGFPLAEGRDLRFGFDRRFDLQVNQGLPFLDFTSARWEVLVAVRNLFRDPMDEASLFDELSVVRPPKRIVGGFLIKF